jgi:two-component system CheB/CheR fusion protein
MTPDSEREQRNAFLVVTGSSAGGIEALSQLVSHLPPSFPASVVVAQHLSPSHVSRLAEILAKHTALSVRSITDLTELEPAVIYVVPPNHNVEIIDDAAVVRIQVSPGPKPSVDRLFTTAAEVYGDRLIAIVLSGLGTDGQSGARAVREAGGTIIVQDPCSTDFPGMPLAIPPTLVDITARPEAMGNIVQAL